MGATAGLGTVGGGAAVTTSGKWDVSEAALSQIDILTWRLSDYSDRLTLVLIQLKKQWFVCSCHLPHLLRLATQVMRQHPMLLPKKER
jgi:hypothetical protein